MQELHYTDKVSRARAFKEVLLKYERGGSLGIKQKCAENEMVTKE